MANYGDDFTGTNGTALGGRTATGSNGGWTWTDMTAGLQIQSNAVRNSASGGAGNAATADLGSADQTAQITATNVVASSGSRCRLRLRANTTDHASYQFDLYGDGSVFEVSSVNAAGTASTIAFRNLTGITGGTIIKGHVSGTTIEGYVQRASDSRWRINTASNTITGTAQAGGASSITLAAGASGTNNLYNNWKVTITGGTGSGQTNTVTAYNGTTKVATVQNAWATPPDNTSTYSVEPWQTAETACISSTNSAVSAGTRLRLLLNSSGTNHVIVDNLAITTPTPANNAPVARFRIASRNNLTVSVENDGSRDPDDDPLTYNIDWGDSTTDATTADAQHTYAAAGTYTITYTVDDGTDGTI